MTQKIRKYFSNEANVSKAIFFVVIIGVFALVFGQSVYAQFIRTTGGSTSYNYGYGFGSSGYGYGYGYGVGGDSSYGFPGIDGKATSVSTSAGRTSFTVTYSTNYLAMNRINYGTTNSYGSNSSQTSSQTGSNSIIVTGVDCNATYHYRVETTDAGGNVWYTADGTVTTTSCSSGGGGGGGGSSGGVTTPPPSDLGCTPGALFSSTTGARCSTPIANCPVGAMFNPMTGARCTSFSTGGTPTGAAICSIPLFTKDLKKGSKGADVSALQAFLTAKEFFVMPVGVAPGYFGPLTRQGVIDYQKAHNITPAVGYFGPITRGSVNAEISAAILSQQCLMK